MSKATFSGVIGSLGARLDEFEQLSLPVYVLDRGGRIVWLNKAARGLVGDALHRRFRDVLAADFRTEAIEHFARKLLGAETASNYDTDIIDRDGRRRGVSLSSVVLSSDHRAVGVFGVVYVQPHPHGSPVRDVSLSPRQLEVLRHLEAGASTEEIAERMGIAVNTARNHIRAVLRALRAHSRLEAVVEARRRRLGD
jgi:DNA-binding CsgD family transcriptional regulator